MNKTNIRVNVATCASCMACQYICSLSYTGSFNPEKAYIVIKPPDEISFTEECHKGCSLCTKYCAFDAIVPVTN
jgi:Fe-S-cluster-containing hydrogenase component 2